MGRSRIRTKLAEAQNWRCAYCGIRVGEPGKLLDSITLDHVIPIHHGGETSADNLVVACFGCNDYRALTPAEVFFSVRIETMSSGSWPRGGRPKKKVRQRLRRLMGADAQWARNPRVLEARLRNKGVLPHVITGADGGKFVLRLVRPANAASEQDQE